MQALGFSAPALHGFGDDIGKVVDVVEIHVDRRRVTTGCPVLRGRVKDHFHVRAARDLRADLDLLLRLGDLHRRYPGAASHHR